MTIEGGSRRHPANRGSMAAEGKRIEDASIPATTGTGGVEATMAAYGYGTWQTHRTLDPVLDASLTAAVALTNGAYPPDPGVPVVKHVIDLAALLASYLTGEEAHDPTDS